MTIDLHRDVRTLTEFKRETTKFLRQMRKTKHPVVLTVNGRPELVALDIGAYREMLDIVDRAEAIAGIQRGLDAFARGDHKPARTVFADLRRKYEVPG